MSLPTPQPSRRRRIPPWAHWGGHWARWRAANLLRMTAERLDPTPVDYTPIAGPPRPYLQAALALVADEQPLDGQLVDQLNPDELARVAAACNTSLRRIAARVRADAAVVPAGYAQGRADLQLVYGSDELLAAMYADPAHPLQAAVDALHGGPHVDASPYDAGDCGCPDGQHEPHCPEGLNLGPRRPRRKRGDR